MKSGLDVLSVWLAVKWSEPPSITNWRLAPLDRQLPSTSGFGAVPAYKELASSRVKRTALQTALSASHFAETTKPHQTGASMSERQILVTAALPYANWQIHIGHLV